MLTVILLGYNFKSQNAVLSLVVILIGAIIIRKNFWYIGTPSIIRVKLALLIMAFISIISSGFILEQMKYVRYEDLVSNIFESKGGVKNLVIENIRSNNSPTIIEDKTTINKVFEQSLELKRQNEISDYDYKIVVHTNQQQTYFIIL